jgi:3-dehydroquinate synthase
MNMVEDTFTLMLGSEPVRIQTGHSLSGAITDWFRSRAPAKIIVITDTNVGSLYGEKAVAALSKAAPVDVLTIPATERSKSVATLEMLLESAVQKGVNKNTCLVSLGGGVVSNVAGVVAGLLLRGLPLVHLPTTVMAQIDASISRKQAINGSRGKNLFGLWRSPEAIFIDWDSLKTLDDRQLRTGLAEAVKLSLIGDLATFERIESFSDPAWFHDENLLVSISAKALQLTCEILQRDPSEGTSGMALEIGHTIGHAIEILKIGDLTHGEAISIGMVLESRICVLKGWTAASWAERIEAVLVRLGLPTRLPADLSPEQIIDALRYDNKRCSDRLSFIPMHEFGRIDQSAPREECVLEPQLLKMVTTGWTTEWASGADSTVGVALRHEGTLA